MDDTRNKPSAEHPVLQGVMACIARHASPGDHVAVGYSGGLDSTVLLHATNEVAARAGVSLSAIHVHHGLSSNADAWAEACIQTCNGLAIPIDVARIEVVVQRGEGVESAARRKRHQVLAAQGAKWVLLAHHADDQAETLLHNLLRGTGVLGAAAMPEQRGRLLRPFLGLARATLLDYAKSHRLAWIEDDSNTDCRYTRNYLRAAVFPLFRTRFPKASEHLAAAAARFGEASNLLDELARLDLAGLPASFPLPNRLLRELPEIRARNLLRAVLGWQGVQAPDERRLNEFVRQLRTAGPDRHPRIDLATYSLWYERGSILFRGSD